MSEKILWNFQPEIPTGFGTRVILRRVTISVPDPVQGSSIFLTNQVNK